MTENDPNYLLDVCKGLEELRRANKDDVKQSQLEAFAGANTITSNLNKYLFTVASLLIPIIFSLISVNEIKQRLNQGDSVLIVLSLSFLFLSLIVGFIFMISEYMYFKKWLKNTERKLEKWSSSSFWPCTPPSAGDINGYLTEYNLLKSRTDEISLEMEKESSSVFLIIQGFCWLIGVVLMICTIFRQLP